MCLGWRGRAGPLAVALGQKKSAKCGFNSGASSSQGWESILLAPGSLLVSQLVGLFRRYLNPVYSKSPYAEVRI